MNYEVVHDPELAFNEQLRMETGWGEVASGLNKVLFGYATLFIGVCIGFGLIVISIYNLTDPQQITQVGKKVASTAAKPSLGGLWCLYLGLGILSVIGFISYCIIVGGQFRCMNGAAERHGARWCMFVCIVCIFLSPAFEFASGVASYQSISELKKNPTKFQDFQLNPMGQWLQLVAFGISMAYPLSFVLFLRAVSVCLRVEWHTMLLNLFLILAMALTGATGYAMYQHRPGMAPIPAGHALILTLGWVAMLLIYVALIALTRICIHSVMSQVKSPLDM